MRRLVRDPWFGPRRFPGWGWTPLTWQGWTVSGVFLVAVVLCGEFIRGIPKAIAIAGLVVLLLAICLLTGTRPGWRR